MEIGYELGLIDRETLDDLKERRRQIADELQRISQVRIKPTAKANQWLAAKHSASLETAVPLSQLLKRPELAYGDLGQLEGRSTTLTERVVRQVEIQCKYEGYLKRQEAEVKKFRNLEKIHIPPEFDYAQIPGLSHEVYQKLSEIQPSSLGQASRISGVTPAAISILMVYLKRLREQSVPSPEK
jgi:tRNA uridine 5-carboxymethylaminomethyl modification enzyme